MNLVVNLVFIQQPNAGSYFVRRQWADLVIRIILDAACGEPWFLRGPPLPTRRTSATTNKTVLTVDQVHH